MYPKTRQVALIQAHIESMLAHKMQCFQLSSKTNENIVRISANFSEKKFDLNYKSLPMVSWDKICQRKKVRRSLPQKMEAINSVF